MPFGRRMSYRPRRRYRRRGYTALPYRGTVKRRFMPTALYKNRLQQMDTRTMYFSVSDVKFGPEIVAGQTQSYIQAVYRTRDLYNQATQTWNIPELENLFNVYDQFQIRAIKVTWYPLNTTSGGAPGTIVQGGGGVPNNFQPYVLRGNIGSFVDQRFRDPVQNPTDIVEICNFASFKMHNADKRFNRVLYRPKSKTGWGECTDITQPVPRQQDPWDGAIFILQNNIVASNPSNNNVVELWYAVYTIKITFRGRRSTL